MEKQVVQNSEDVRKVLIVLRQLFDKPAPPRKEIGYRIKREQ
jgi:hypothetical protein